MVDAFGWRLGGVESVGTAEVEAGYGFGQSFPFGELELFELFSFLGEEFVFLGDGGGGSVADVDLGSVRYGVDDYCVRGYGFVFFEFGVV